MQKQTRKNVICSVLALLLALTALTALSYNIIYGTSDTFIIRAENGFSLMSFSSDHGRIHAARFAISDRRFLHPATSVFLLFAPL